MGLSRQEVNLRRLLAKCELMVKGNQCQNDKFDKYVFSLEEMVKDILKGADKPQDETINDYKRRIYNIKSSAGLVEEHDKEFLLNEIPNQNEHAREELLGVGVRQRKPGMDDLEEAINYHQNMQEKIATDMLQLTQNLKEQSKLANQIIKKDTETVGRSTQITEQNFTRLKTESEKLTEHSKRACKCWMWIMLGIVFIVFINMVLFMKVMKKK